MLVAVTALFLVPSTTAMDLNPDLTGIEMPVTVVDSDPVVVSDASVSGDLEWLGGPIPGLSLPVDSETSTSESEGPLDALLEVPEGYLQTASVTRDSQVAILNAGAPVPFPFVPEGAPLRNINAIGSVQGQLFCARPFGDPTDTTCRDSASSSFSPSQYNINWCVGPCNGWGTTDGKIIIHLTSSGSDTGWYTAWCIQVPNGVYSGATCYDRVVWQTARQIEGQIFQFSSSGWFATGAYESS